MTWLTLGFITLVSTSHAHVKWFVDTKTAAIEGFKPYSLTEPAVIIWIGLGMVALAVSFWLDEKLPIMKIQDTKIRHDFIDILRTFTGISFFLTAYEGAVVAPHLAASSTFAFGLVFLQAFIGILLISNRALHHAGMLIGVLYFGLIVQFSFLSALEYANILGIACFIALNYLPDGAFKDKYKPYSVDLLRIFTGVALITLGISEKLMGALYGQTFVLNYGWNFMEMLGFTMFDDRLFVLCAGAVEVILGLIIICGTTTRLTILLVSFFMLTSNTVFILQGNNDAALMEVVGHLPIIGIALVLILLGYGQRLKITEIGKKEK